MPKLPAGVFEEAVKMAVRKNERFVPPYESGASLYIRPVLFGITPQIGVSPAKDYLFIVFTSPVGPYFKGGFAANPYVITRKYDRSAPLGTGIYKVGGNYAASLRAHEDAREAGYSSEFYLDAKEKKYIDECGAANFFGIKDNTYITPKSTSILPSITNKSLMQLAEDLGMKVERRPIPEEELSTFDVRQGRQARPGMHGLVSQVGGHTIRRRTRYPRLGYDSRLVDRGRFAAVVSG